jgi:Surface glycan-binding protein B xyloglucan binding domain
MITLSMAMAWIYTSCTDDENAEPRVRYIRVTDPEAADSLLTTASQGQMIAIIGENLADVQQIWFNDLAADVTPTYITNKVIITTVPADIPGEISNKLRLVFKNGKVLEHPFAVDISEPVISHLVSEYVNEGGVADLRGNYFYEPLTVTFTGGVEGEVVDVSDDGTRIQVTVPEGAEPGPITVTTNFGEDASDFWFRDSRNIFISSDPFTGWWNASFVVTNPGPSDPESINGNYIRVKQPIGGWAWVEVAGGPPSAMGDISKNIPDEAIMHPEDYNLKFEINTMKPFNNNVIKITAGLNDFNNDEYRWVPPYDTKGEWQTVVIPFDEIADSYGTPLAVSADGYYTRLLFHGPGALDADISFDNFRIVPKTLD